MAEFHDGGGRMPGISRAGCLLTALMAIVATGCEAKVLRNKDGAPTVMVFKSADELRRFNKLANKQAGADIIESLLACRTPQGTRIEVLGSGYRTAFVKVVDGLSSGCQGTVPIGRVQEQ
jgi:hypothetical protein